MKCRYKHHKSHGKELGKCEKHPDVELVCSPFYCKVCVKCNPEFNRRCGICGATRLNCCC